MSSLNLCKKNATKLKVELEINLKHILHQYNLSTYLSPESILSAILKVIISVTLT